MQWSKLQLLCMEEKQSIDLGWERMLEESLEGESTLCGVDLPFSQVIDLYCELSTQQTNNILPHLKFNKDSDDFDFPLIDSEFE